MLYTQKTLATLEYHKIIAMLAAHAMTEGARARALSLLPSEDYDTVLSRQRHTADARRMVVLKAYPPFGGVVDVVSAVERAEKGATLSPRELLDIAQVLFVARALSDYQHTDRGGELDAGNSLLPYFERLLVNRTLENKIRKAILAEDTIADEASTALAEIRRKIRAENSRIKEILQKYTSGAYAKYLQENIITTRDGRYVIPVKIECRNEIRGLVHDTSSSGATVFVEPMGVVDANNELRILAGKEEEEVARILSELSALCADAYGTIIEDYRTITDLAFFFTCAALAEEMHAEMPILLQEPTVSLVRARHPLLDREKVVPIDVSLGEDYKTLVITGPNTGGKTVTLKTIGLFSLMVQAGLQIPAEESSRIGVFSDILVDIGDEQSIEQSLSTFSSHMVNIVSILAEAGERSLVLFDELGAGTDPVEGAALANAILEEVRARGALTAATTHYAELKAYALETEGVQNASCEFDIHTLRPTYRLIVGTPGRSNAFAISQKLGLDEGIIEHAKALLSGSSKRFEDVIDRLEENRIEMEKSREEAARLRREYEAFKKDAEKKLASHIRDSEKEIEKTREKARQILESARATSDFVMAELEAVKKKRDSRQLGEEMAAAKRAMRARMQETSNEIYDAETPSIPDEEYTLPRPLAVGDRVFLVSFRQEGVVLDLPDKSGNVSVRAGILTAKVPLSRLRLLGGKDGDFAEVHKKQHSAENKEKKRKGATTAAPREFHQEIDVRGMIGADAWEKVDKFLDDALLAGLSSVRIIHGKGTGALRAALQNDLRHDPRVARYRNGVYGEGDHGVTVVDLK